jgi:transposase-like protein
LRSYPAAKVEIAELANMKHVFVKAPARLNARAENGHQPTRQRERRMRSFRDPKRTQKIPRASGQSCNMSRLIRICRVLTLSQTTGSAIRRVV